MQFIMPYVHIQGDRIDGSDQEFGIMSRSGELVGVIRSRAVWRFGFMPGSPNAKAFDVSTPTFYWYLTDRNGKVLATFEGFACELPARFKEVIDGAI
jgi:hypothetical protein